MNERTNERTNERIESNERLAGRETKQRMISRYRKSLGHASSLYQQWMVLFIHSVVGGAASRDDDV
jgi:hypothetical protein